MPRANRSNPGHGFGAPRYPGTFLLALREAFGTLNWQVRRWLGDAVEYADATGREQTLALENLYRRLRPVQRSAWPETLAAFLAAIPDEALANPPASLAEVADRILVRLGPPFTTHDPDLHVWSRRLVEGQIVATLVVDYPNSMSYVTAEMVVESGEAGEYWFERALENLRGQSPAGCLVEVHADSGLLQCEIGDAYDSSRALILDHLLPEKLPDGAFVAVPGRDHLLVLPVSASALSFLPWLHTVAVKTHRSFPYPISAELFWVSRGRWLPFPVETRGEKVVVNPPREFLDVLARIAPDLPEERLEEPDGEVPN
jgi:hypothetical protein